MEDTLWIKAEPSQDGGARWMAAETGQKLKDTESHQKVSCLQCRPITMDGLVAILTTWGAGHWRSTIPTTLYFVINLLKY